MSLIELLIAMTITLVIMAATTAIFLSNSQSRQETERTSQGLENARYAQQQLMDDLQMAGYWAEFNIGNAGLATPVVLPNPCTDASSPANLTLLANAMPLAVQGYHLGSTLTCISDVMANTDVLVVRRVSGCVAGPTAAANCSPPAGVPYLQASECANSNQLNATVVSSTISGGTIPGQFLINTDTTKLTLNQRDCATTAGWHQFLVHIYYVANNDQAGDGIPTLKRAELGAGAGNAAWTYTSIAEGVENFQVQYGINTNNDHLDTTGTRAPNVFLADPYNTTTTGTAGCAASVASPCPSNFFNTVAIQLNLLVRNTTTTLGYTDSKTYNLGAVTVGPFNDNRERHAYTQEVMLWNLAIR